MENREKRYSGNYSSWESGSGRSGRIFAGLIIILVGTALLIRQLGFMDLPYWLFSWKMLLIVIGLFIGAKSSFQNIGWAFPFFVGVFFLLEDLFPEWSIRTYFWPMMIIGAGFWIMFGPRGRCFRRHRRRSLGKDQDFHSTSSTSIPGTDTREDFIDSVSIFGGIKKNILSKDFKGGDIVTIFGGAEYNLSHADFKGDVTLEVVQLFGGTRLIIPPQWEVKSEMVAILGSVEDKRPIPQENSVEPDKRLILKGVSIFGGIELKSYYQQF